jgi:hypothetical protein
MKFFDRIKAAWHALRNEDEPTNQGHRYAIVIGENGFYADEYRINPYDGQPEWYYEGPNERLHCRKMDGWVLKDFKPEMSLKQFEDLTQK